MFLMYSLVRRKADWFGKLCPEPFFIVSIVEKWFTKLPLLSIPKTIRLEPNSSLTLEFNLSSSVLIGFASQDAVLKQLECLPQKAISLNKEKYFGCCSKDLNKCISCNF